MWQHMGWSVPWMSEPTWLALAWVLLAVLLLDFFDISLPRGDSVGVAGALVGAALVLAGPIRALAISVISALVAHSVRRGAGQPRRLLIVLASRSLALIAGTFALYAYPRYWSSMGEFTLIPGVFLVTELIAAQALAGATSGRPLLRLLRGNAASQAPLIAAQWSAAALLLLTYSRGMGYWSLIPVAILLLLIRQSYAQFLEIRETYRTTVEVLVEAAETQDLRRVGHADRTAAVARAIAMRMGLSPASVERLSYAALLHDIGELSDAAIREDESSDARLHSAAIVHGVEFFSPVEPVLRICDGDAGPMEDSDDLLAALIVALASDIDCGQNQEAANAHRYATLDAVASRVPSGAKARVVAAAIELGFRVPSVG